MKRPRNLSVAESNHVKQFRLNPGNWGISKKMAEKWLLVHRETGRTRLIPAP